MQSSPSNIPATTDIEKLLKVVTESHVLMNQMIHSFNNLMGRVDSLATDMRDILAAVQRNSNEIASLKTTGERETYSSVARRVGPPSPQTYSTFVALQALEERKLHKKDNNIVLVGTPEIPGEDIKDKVLEEVSKAGMDPSCVEDVFRNGISGTKAARIVKVKLANPESKRKVKYFLGRSNLCSFARDDLCKLQLQEDRAMRQWCYEKNRELGERRFKVVDLKVVENRRPQVLGGAEDSLNEVRSFEDDQ